MRRRTGGSGGYRPPEDSDLQPIHKAHNQERLSNTEQLTSTGPSPHWLHHLDIHACDQRHGKINPQRSILLAFALLCFGYRGDFPKVRHPKVQVGFWSCWLQTPTSKKGWFCLNCHVVRQHTTDMPRWTPGTSFQACGNHQGEGSLCWSAGSAYVYSRITTLTYIALKENGRRHDLGSEGTGLCFFFS